LRGSKLKSKAYANELKFDQPIKNQRYFIFGKRLDKKHPLKKPAYFFSGC
jgi:hypothetical protein